MKTDTHDSWAAAELRRYSDSQSEKRLRDAAPELLEALEELNFRALIASGIEIGSKATLPGKLGAAMLAAGRAIAKATGRGEA